ETAAFDPDPVGGDEVEPLGLELGARVGFDIAGLGGETNDQGRAPRVRCDLGEHVPRTHQFQGERVHAWSLLQLARRDFARRPVGHRRGGDVGIGGQRPEHRFAQLRRAAHVDAAYARRRLQVHGAGDQHGVGAGARRGFGDGETHLAAAAVADEAHRVDVLVGRAGAHQDAAAGEEAVHCECTRACTIATGSRMRPGPDSPSASGPSSGPMTCTPRSRSVAMLACVAGCSHMRWFMAGATATGAVVARHRVATRSSARPWASLAMVLAVAGATITCCAQRASSRWPIAASAPASHSEVRTGRCDAAWKVWAPTNRCAASVIATCTVAPASRRRRTSSTALYAAIPPVTHNSTRRPSSPCFAVDPAVAMSRNFLTRIRATSLPEPALHPDPGTTLQAL